MDSWRGDQEGWCTRTDASLSSLADNSRVLSRRCQAQQQAIGELGERVTQANLSATVTAALKAAEAAATTALADVTVRIWCVAEALRHATDEDKLVCLSGKGIKDNHTPVSIQEFHQRPIKLFISAGRVPGAFIRGDRCYS